MTTHPTTAPNDALQPDLPGNSDNGSLAARQRRLYEAILTNTPDLAYIFDLQHRFIYANDGLLKMWGKTSAQALGKTCLELGYEPWHAAMHDHEIDQVVATRQPVRGEVPFEGAFGRRIYDYIFVPVIGADGEVEAVAGTTRDVTEQHETRLELRRLATELAEADRRKTEFLAVLAHELRNPLAPISNAVHVLRSAPDRANVVRASAEIMQRQLGHLVRLVNDLIDVSRITSGNIELRCERVVLTDVLAHAVEACRPTLAAARQTLKFELPDEPLPLEADPVRLSQVFCNLLNNASKYSGPESPIHLGASRDGDEVRITVRDEGIGIPGDKLEDIFHMFTQVDARLDSARSGLGVGLALVRTLVNLHGGRIHASSAGPGQGSEFELRLPLARD